MNSSASVELRYEKCLLIWGNARALDVRRKYLIRRLSGSDTRSTHSSSTRATIFLWMVAGLAMSRIAINVDTLSG